ncbi:unnamed protein product, partial [Allacma fusca]
MSLYVFQNKHKHDKEPEYGLPVDKSSHGNASPPNAEVGLSVVETDDEIPTSSSRTSDEDPFLDASSSMKSSCHYSIQSVGSSRQSLQHNFDEILLVPNEKKQWFRLTGKRKETKDKKKEEPKPKPPKNQTKGKSLPNLQQDLQRSSGQALRSTSPTASIASISTRSIYQSLASSRTSLSEHETASIKSKGRFSFIRVGSKSKGKPQPPSSRSPSPAQTQAEVEARAKEKLEKLTKAVQRKS